MDHKAFLSGLSKNQRADLTELSDSKGLRHLLGHAVAIAVCSALVLAQVPAWPLLLVVQGILLVFLFTLQHETCHKTPFKTPWINDLIGHICGFVLFLPAIWFRFFHLAHHRHTQDPDNDPELAEPKPTDAIAYAKHISGIPVWFSQLKTLSRNAAGRADYPYVPNSRRRQVISEARAYLLGYLTLMALSLWLGSTALILLWIVPLLLGQPFLRLYLLAEHGRCALVADMFENTRTTFTNRLVRALAWNMPYHAEHHCYPTVPFHNLPKLHDLTQAHLQVTSDGYGRFTKDYVKTMDRLSSDTP